MTETLIAAQDLTPGDTFRYFSTLDGGPAYGPYTVVSISRTFGERTLHLTVREDANIRHFLPNTPVEVQER